MALGGWQIVEGKEQVMPTEAVCYRLLCWHGKTLGIAERAAAYNQRQEVAFWHADSESSVLVFKSWIYLIQEQSGLINIAHHRRL